MIFLSVYGAKYTDERHKSKKLTQKDEAFLRISPLFRDRYEKNSFFVNYIHLLPVSKTNSH